MGNNSGNHQTNPEDILNAQELVEEAPRPAEPENPGLSIPPGRDQPKNPAGDKPIDSPDRPIGDKPAVPGDEDKVA